MDRCPSIRSYLVAGATRSVLALLTLLAMSAPAMAEGIRFSHKPPKPETATDLIIRTKITATGGVLEPSLYFRKSGTEYTRVVLQKKGSGQYEARLPASLLVGADALEYYLGAFSAKDLTEGLWRSKAEPYHLNLRAESARSVKIRTTPPGAIIDIDGVTVGPSPHSAPLPPGPHHLTARLNGYDRLDFDFSMPAAEDLDLPLPLIAAHGGGVVAAPVVHVAEPVKPAVAKPEPAPVVEAPPSPSTAPPAVLPAGKGRVWFVTQPPGATVSIDGDDAGASPVERLLAPGSYIFAVSLSSYRTMSTVVNVTAGNTIEKNVVLKAVAPSP